MTILFVILILIVSIILGLIVLIQNPKGGGLAGSFGGFGNQLMGVKQTTDVLEKGTWVFAGLIGILCLVSTFFISGNASGAIDKANKASGAIVPGVATPMVPAPTQLPANTTTLPDTTKK